MAVAAPAGRRPQQVLAARGRWGADDSSLGMRTRRHKCGHYAAQHDVHDERSEEVEDAVRGGYGECPSAARGWAVCHAERGWAVCGEGVGRRRGRGSNHYVGGASDVGGAN